MRVVFCRMVIIFVRKWLMKRLIFSFALVLVGVQPVSAQDETGCPNGETATGPRSPANPLGCVPNPQAQNNQPAQPRGRWEARWGSIAIGSTSNGGGVGFSTNMIAKRQANKVALAACKADGGGGKCSVKLSYYNQCAVIAWGDTQYVAQSKESIDAATQLAISRCSKVTTNCKIVYAECSLPVWVQ
jgi:hypothetical protein